MQALKRPAEVFKTPADARVAITTVGTKQRLSMPPIVWLPLMLRNRVSENIHINADVARALITAAIKLAEERLGTTSPFHEFDAELGQLKKWGTAQTDETQGLEYSRDVYADITRQLKSIGLTDPTRRGERTTSELGRGILINHDSLAPVVKMAGEPLWLKIVQVQMYLAENEGRWSPSWLKAIGIGDIKYHTICRLGQQAQFILLNLDELLESVDWLHFQEVSQEYREHWLESDAEFRTRFGLKEPVM